MNLPGVIVPGESARAARQRSTAAKAAALVPERDGECRTRSGWLATRLISQHKRLSLYRVRPIDQLSGPGCYVLKTLSRDWKMDRTGAAMLRREVAVASAVNNAHVISILDNQISGDARPYLILPYLEGISLRRLLSNREADSTSTLVPIASAIWFARQTAAALAALHAGGWLHGQLRPEHLMISPAGQLTVIDLSQCRRLATDECDVVSTPPDSPIYSAPETFSACQKLTTATDVYSLGVVLFEALAGRPPFVASDPNRLALCHRREAPPEIRQLRPQIPREVSQLVKQMLAKEPLRRPTATEVAQWLMELEIEELSLSA